MSAKIWLTLNLEMALVLMAVIASKELVNKADELSLEEGIKHERRIFADLYDTEDQKEGMKAFVEKRKAVWKDM